jgi:hypothetical protein
MLDSPESLLLGSSDNFAIVYETRGGIPMVSVETEDQHWDVMP